MTGGAFKCVLVAVVIQRRPTAVGENLPNYCNELNEEIILEKSPFGLVTGTRRHIYTHTHTHTDAQPNIHTT